MKLCALARMKSANAKLTIILFMVLKHPRVISIICWASLKMTLMPLVRPCAPTKYSGKFTKMPKSPAGAKDGSNSTRFLTRSLPVRPLFKLILIVILSPIQKMI